MGLQVGRRKPKYAPNALDPPRLNYPDPPWKEAVVPTQTYQNIFHIGQTLRLQNLPADTTEKDIVEFFEVRLDSSVPPVEYGLSKGDHSLNTPTPANNPAEVHRYIQTVGVIYSGPDSAEQRATVTF